MKRRQQLEMPFGSPLGLRRSGGPCRRPTRARWWFDQMRRAVDHAPDWDPAGTPQDDPAAARPPDLTAPR